MSATASAKPLSLLLKTRQSDPVYAAFQKVFRSRAVLAAFVCALIHLVLEAGLSQVVRMRYTCANCIYFTDASELTWGVFLWGVFMPILWGYYVSSGRMWSRMVFSLVEEKVVDEDIKSILVKPSYPILSLTLALGIGLLYRFNTIPSEIALGHISFWFVTDWSKAIISFMVGFNSYIFVSFVLKTIILSSRMRWYFDQHGVKKVQIFSADDCGGFGVVGKLAMRISSLAVLVGVWAAWYCLLPVFVGGEPNFSTSVIMLYMAYFILVPLLLFLIARPVHRAMTRYKHSYKEDVAGRLEELFAAIDKLDLVRASCEGDTARYLDDYKRLREVYERIDAMPDWPISLGNFKKFTGIASVPGVIGFVTFIIDMVDYSRQIPRFFQN